MRQQVSYRVTEQSDPLPWSLLRPVNPHAGNVWSNHHQAISWSLSSVPATCCGQPRLPEPLAEPRLDLTINIASAISFEVFEGEYIQIIDVEGRQCSDFLAFHRKALDTGRCSGSTRLLPAR